MGAVITTRAIADAFANGMEYFNTFGGNPVSCAVGLAVLDVIDEEDLRTRAAQLGARLQKGLRELAADHPLIGDVRGRGLFLGVELVDGTADRAPAARQARYLVERMKENGVLLSTDGPHHNVIKIKPPLVLEERDVDRILASMEGSLKKFEV
jgi:4-aminobutyrate aminotransferase-like enzyme